MFWSEIRQSFLAGRCSGEGERNTPSLIWARPRGCSLVWVWRSPWASTSFRWEYQDLYIFSYFFFPWNWSHSVAAVGESCLCRILSDKIWALSTNWCVWGGNFPWHRLGYTTSGLFFFFFTVGVERKPGALKDSLWRHGDGCLKQRASGLTFCYVFFSTAQHVYSSPRCVQKWTGVNSLYAIDRSFIYYRFLWTQIILKLIGSSGFCLTPGALCKHLRNILTDERMTASSTWRGTEPYHPSWTMSYSQFGYSYTTAPQVSVLQQI